MTLTTHGAVGAGIMVAFSSNPVLGGVLAFGSHFLLDALPHLDYKILSLDKDVHKESQTVKLKWGREVILDLIRIGLDFNLGMLSAVVIYFLFSFNVLSIWFILTGAFLGMLPDLLQFVYGQVGGRVLGLIQNFHNFTHTPHRLEGKIFLGTISQLSVICLVFVLLNLYK